MGKKTKIQLIERASGHNQFYVNFQTAIAEAMEFTKGECFEWVIKDKNSLILKRCKNR